MTGNASEAARNYVDSRELVYRGNPVKKLDPLEARIRRGSEEISRQMIAKTFANFQERCENCIQKHGFHKVWGKFRPITSDILDSILFVLLATSILFIIWFYNV